MAEIAAILVSFSNGLPPAAVAEDDEDDDEDDDDDDNVGDINSLAITLPSTVMTTAPSTPSLKTDRSTSGRRLAANILEGWGVNGRMEWKDR